MSVEPGRVGASVVSVAPSEVQEFLRRKGWSQARLAWEIGVNQPRISRFIHGLKRPNRDLERALVGLVRAGPRPRAGRGRPGGRVGAAPCPD
ncbi:helix-turn-helix domain-containing protein [Methylobacterium planeticum]|uniref:Helix-turn-helix transcriptional regulator n=1 Tax=Methylobacterium planeticum TaxID=2615211 RepID=A0A6N6MNT2_9HYPH|nr:helix-turn-helix transcriptional regulator [Methylobacterium planeticum]KAB1070096.1 helix-turn-helix transcriptional regulator [Methylobacterium planeticum]